MISYTNRFSEHNIDIGVISNDSLRRIYTCIRHQKSNSTLLKSGNYVLYDMFEGIYNTRVPSWNHSLVIFAIFVRNSQKSLPEY